MRLEWGLFMCAPYGRAVSSAYSRSVFILFILFDSLILGYREWSFIIFSIAIEYVL